METSEFRYWSSKMIGAPVLGFTIAPGTLEPVELPPDRTLKYSPVQLTP